VSSLNPLDGIEVAITHLALGTTPDSDEAKDPLNPHQRITLEQALHAYTLGKLRSQQQSLFLLLHKAFSHHSITDHLHQPVMPLLVTGSAYAACLDKETGSIEVGKAADIIVLDKDLFALPAHEIHTAKVTHTFVDGALVYTRSPSVADTREVAP
jgi:predicted amidohydrolase YtcJ